MTYEKMTKIALIVYLIIAFIGFSLGLDWLVYICLSFLFIFLFFVAYKKRSKKDFIILVVAIIILSVLLMII